MTNNSGQKKKRGNPGKVANDTKVVSFRLAASMCDEIESVVRGECDDTGFPLNIHTAARRLVMEALNERKRKSTKKQ